MTPLYEKLIEIDDSFGWAHSAWQHNSTPVVACDDWRLDIDDLFWPLVGMTYKKCTT
jgi:hypothetical protein